MKIEANSLSPQEYVQLRSDVGWGCPNRNDTETALQNSLIVFVKRIHGKAVGSVRVVGDGKLCFYVQDLMVLKEFRLRGIATELMEAVMKYLETNAAFNAFIGLMAAKGMDRFYQKFGFMTRPNDHMGPGMIMFYGRPGELRE